VTESITSAGAFRAVDQLSGQVADWQSRYESTVVKLDTANADNRALVGVLSHSQEENAELRCTAAHLVDVVGELREHLDDLRGELAALRGKLRVVEVERDDARLKANEP